MDQKLKDVMQVLVDSYVVCGTKVLAMYVAFDELGLFVGTRSKDLVG